MDRDTAAIIAVSRTLRHLFNAERPFHVASSLFGDRGDVQHLVVGCTGVFAIETSSLNGLAHLDARRRTRASQHQVEQHLALARRGAALVRDRLRRRGYDLTVQPVLCVPYADLDRPQYCDGVIVTRREHLDYLIRHWPGQSLTQTHAARVFSAIQPRIHRAAA